LVRTTVTAPVSTLYARTGDLFGWLCVAISALLLCVERVTRKRVSRTRQDKASLAGVSA
jgi:apolipoprotein N-acyltransferase